MELFYILYLMLLFSELNTRTQRFNLHIEEPQNIQVLNLKVTVRSDMGHLKLISEFQEDIPKLMKSDINRHLYDVLKYGVDLECLVTKPDSECKYSCRFYKPLLKQKTIKTKLKGKNLQLNIRLVDTTKKLKCDFY